MTPVWKYTHVRAPMLMLTSYAMVQEEPKYVSLMVYMIYYNGLYGQVRGRPVAQMFIRFTLTLRNEMLHTESLRPET